MNVSVGVSNRHVHLKEKDYKSLFGREKFDKEKELSQPGEFVSTLKVDLITEKNEIKNVSVLGPLREYSQVEISKTDSYKLGLNPPVRSSGKLEGSESITLRGPKGEVNLSEGVIIANRHLHVPSKDLEKYELQDGNYVKANVRGEKGGILNNVIIKSGDYTFELHLDTDDANAHLINNGDVVEIIK